MHALPLHWLASGSQVKAVLASLASHTLVTPLIARSALRSSGGNRSFSKHCKEVLLTKLAVRTMVAVL